MNSANHRLKLDETIHKGLISTTSRLVGEYEGHSIRIDHAWPDFSSQLGFARYHENPASRSAFMIVFQTEPYKREAGVVVRNYSPTGEQICSYLSLIYGKRFDFHGLVESGGMYQIPDLSVYSSLSDQRLPFNSHRERKCFGVPLDLSHFTAASKIFTGIDVDPKFLNRLNTACKFYVRALQSAESDYEFSYIQLIMAWEIMSRHFDYSKDELLDEDILRSLTKIKDALEGGEEIAKQLSNRMLAIKRTFVKSISSLVDDEFFLSKETDLGYGFFRPEDFCKRIGAAYDLRSKYVHTGVPFGRWIRPEIHSLDTQTGKPVVEDREYANILEKAPTLLGLERIIRYCLLKIMISNGFQDIEKIRSGTKVDVGCKAEDNDEE